MPGRQIFHRFLSSNSLIFLTTALFHGLTARNGPKVSPDSRLFIQLTDALLRGDALKIFATGAHQWTKAFVLSLFALLRLLTPAYWMTLIVIINIVCSATVAVLVVALVRAATRSVAAPAAALLLYLTAFSIFSWIPFVLTDVVFLLVAFVPFALLARTLLVGAPRATSVMVLLLVLAPLTRPPGVLLIPLVIFADLLFVRRPTEQRRRVLIVLLLMLLVASVFARTAIVRDASRWPFDLLRPMIAEWSGREKQGEVVNDRLETARRPARTFSDHLVIESDRFVRYFQVTSSRFSRVHNVANSAYFIPLYVLGVIGTVQGWRSADRRRRAFVRMLLLWVGAFAFFHSMTVLDFDWRFRLPVMPHLILLASIGVDALAARWERERSSAATAADAQNIAARGAERTIALVPVPSVVPSSVRWTTPE